MIRNLFFQELKRTVIPGAGLGLAAAAFLTIGRPLWLRVSNALDVDDRLDKAAMALILLSALAVGSAAFSKEFREGPLPLLESLPISRYWIWSIRVLACFASLVTVSLVLVFARPGLLAPDFYAGLVFPLYLFCAAVCVSLLIRATLLASFAFSGIISLPLVAYSLVLSSHFLPDTSEGFVVFLAVLLSVFSGLFLVLSAWMFALSECNLPRRRLRNILTTGSGLLIGGVLLGAIGDSHVLFRRPDWRTNSYFSERTISKDGRYLAILQDGSPYNVSRILVVDVESADIRSSVETWNTGTALWTDNGSLVAVTMGSFLDRLAGLGVGTVRVQRVFPSPAQLFARRSAAWTGSVEGSPGGYLKLTTGLLLPYVSDEDAPFPAGFGRNQFLQIDAEGKVREISGAPPVGRLLQVTPVGALLASRNGTLTSIHPDHIEKRTPYERYTKKTAKAGAQTSPQGVSDPLLPGTFITRTTFNTSTVEETPFLFYFRFDPARESGRLLARAAGEKEWNEAFANIAASRWYLRWYPTDRNVFDAPWPDGDFGLDVTQGLAAYIHELPAGDRIEVYDASSKARFSIGPLEKRESGETRGVRFRRVPGSSKAVLQVTSQSPSHLQNVLRKQYIFDVVSGPLEVIAGTRKLNGLLFLREDGLQIYSDNAHRIFSVRPGHEPRQLWPRP